MTHRERVRAAIKGQDVDRVPVSMWRHFFSEETSADSLAGAMVGFQRRYDWDFMKINPRASYHVEDWGVRLKYEGDDAPRVIETPIKSAADWLDIEVLDIRRGALGEQLKSLQLIARELRGDVPFIMTVFTPLSIASRLVDSESDFLKYLREDWDKVVYAMEVIAETFTSFSKACLETGASGLFFASTTWATADRFTEDEYRYWSKPFDLKILNSLPDDGFSVMHVCGDNILLNAVHDYPVQAFNWDARKKGNPSLVEGKSMVNGRAVIGGIAHDRTLVESSPEILRSEITGMRIGLGDKGWFLGPGCTFPPETPDGNIQAIREAVK